MRITPEESSLDRYLESQAGLILSHASLRRGMVIMGIVGAGMLTIAFAFVVASVVLGKPGMIGGAIGPGFAGLVNLVMSQVMRRRAKPSLETNANLTPEARSFMANLMKDVYGWPKAWGAVEPHMLMDSRGPYTSRFDRVDERHAWRSMLSSGSWGNRQHSAKQILNEESFDVLNRAAFQYNRIFGVLRSGNADVARFSASVKGAADQAMADVFHVGYLLEDLPEGSLGAKAKAEQEVSALTELADRLEQMQNAAPLADPVVQTKSPVASVLEELRLDQLARTELSKTVEEKHINVKGE